MYGTVPYIAKYRTVIYRTGTVFFMFLTQGSNDHYNRELVKKIHLTNIVTSNEAKNVRFASDKHHIMPYRTVRLCNVYARFMQTPCY